ncbi:MAG: O-antigen ligase family protein [bacterium]
MYLVQSKALLNALFLLLAVFTAVLISNLGPTISLAITLTGVIFVISFASTEMALYLLIFSMLLSPEFGSRGTTGGGATIRVDDFLLIIIGFSWLIRMAIYKELGLFLETKLNRPILYFVVVCFFATAIGMISGRVAIVTGFLFVIKYIEYFVIYFMVTFYVKERKQVRNFLLAMFLTCIVVCLVAMWQIPMGERVTAPFEGKGGEPNTLGGYLVFILALTLGLLLQLPDNRRRLWLGGFCVVIFVPLLFTLSRSSWVALIPMYLIFIIATHHRLALLMVLVVGVLAAPFLMPKSIKERIEYTFQNKKVVEWQEKIGDVTLDTSSSARIHDWREALRAFLKHPIFGYGITGWQFVDNQYIRTLVELGLLGLCAFLGLLYVILKEVWHIYKNVRTPFARGLTLGLFAGTIALMTHSFGTNTFIIVRIMEPYWFVMGMVLVLPLVEFNRNGAQSA